MRHICKRAICVVLALIFLVGCISTVSAANEKSGIILAVDSEKVLFPDAQPYLDAAHRTMVPIRFVTEAMGADVKWNSKTETAVITKGKTTVEIKKGEKFLTVTNSGKKSTVEMDTAAVVQNGRTFVPIRFVVEAIGGHVDYSNYYGVAEITSCSGELTAADIERLRLYEPIQWYNKKYPESKSRVYNEDAKVIFRERKTKRWFADAHNLLITCNEGTKVDIGEIVTNQTMKKGTSASDFAKAVDEFVEGWVERETYGDKTVGSPVKGEWNGYDGAGKNMTASLSTDTALTYHPLSPTQSCINVRGVMTITPHRGMDEKKFKSLFGQTMELEKEYKFDVEFVVTISQYNMLRVSASYRFDENGSAILIK